MIRLIVLGGLTAAALTAGSMIVAGPDAGAAPQVNVFRRDTFEQLGGVRVAVGDVDGDKVLDIITGPAAGAPPHVKVFSGSNGGLLLSFNAYDPQYLGGVNVAGGDIDGDGRDDIITSGGVNGHVKVFNASNGSTVRDFFAFGQNYNGGVHVGAADLNGDGIDDIITGSTAGAGGHVKVFDGITMAEPSSFHPFGDGFTGGVFVATSADVPEPQTWLLSGFALLCLWRKRSALRDSVN
ncbi:MAG: FG-GAP-like repeat-containing protein [Bryobacteraceae bacterium]